MKHYIIAKFKDRNDLQNLYQEISDLFQKVLDLKGVEKVELHKSNSTRENRYSLMIVLTLTPEGLEEFDASDVHREWKERYGARLESKAIFDCE
jgi:hypothetical protein